MPEHHYEIKKYFIRQRYNFLNSKASLQTTTIDYLNRNQQVNDLFEQLAGYSNVTILHIDNFFKSDGFYLTIVNANPLYIDNNHLSLFGLNYVQPIFDEYFRSQY